MITHNLTNTVHSVRQGWTDREAALVCQQLGLIYNPDQGTASQRMVAPPDMPVLMAWVACDEVDEDLTGCRAVRGSEVTCSHDLDVFLRCREPTWAGEMVLRDRERVVLKTA